jgi:hypothetical protein
MVQTHPGKDIAGNIITVGHVAMAEGEKRLSHLMHGGENHGQDQ